MFCRCWLGSFDARCDVGAEWYCVGEDVGDVKTVLPLPIDMAFLPDASCLLDIEIDDN